MSEYTLRNSSVFQGNDRIFVTNGDHHILEVSGASVHLIAEVIKGFESNSNSDQVFNRVSPAFENDRDLFNETLDWLVSNRILIESSNGSSQQKKTIRVHIVSPPISETDQDRICSQLSVDAYRYVPVNKTDAEFILILSPLFEQFDSIKEINLWAFENKIPVCHAGIDESTFTLGPIADSRIDTPCLNCYSKRKISNLMKPAKTINFIRFSEKKKLAAYNITKNPFFDVMLVYLRNELEKYFRSGGYLCGIIGKSIVFDNFNYEISKSKILKTPGCPVCNQELLVSPLNG